MPNHETATLNYKNQQYTLAVHKGTLGPEAVEVSGFAGEGFFTFDPGFASTAACESKITFIDGQKGILLYRGYPIEQLAKKSDFMEVSYLLLYGELPDQRQKADFIKIIASHSMLHEQMYHFYNGFRRDAHPMAIMMGVVGALSAFYHESLDVTDQEDQFMSAFRLIAKMPTIAAMCYKYSNGLPFMYPRNDLDYASNFLRMLFANPAEKYKENPVLSRALDRIFILHADHEQNASTSTVRVAGSTGANPFACISAGIGALWGPAHGGANEAALNMLRDIGDESRIGKYIAKAKDRDDPFRLMGFGHRVYKNYDPRAKVMRETCHEVLEETGSHGNPLFKLAMKLEKIALEDEYFIEKKLYPNVDFYSGITLSALGIPTNMFTVIFALARTVGWISQWIEMMSDPKRRLSRPRQVYTGHTQRDVKPIEERK